METAEQNTKQLTKENFSSLNIKKIKKHLDNDNESVYTVLIE